MALVTSDLILLTSAGIKTNFEGAYLEAQEEADWKAIATEIETTLPIQNYAWLGRGAVMKQFKDEAEAQSVLEHDYTLADIIYKGNLEVQRKSLEDDQYGLIMRRAANLGQEPARHWNELAYLGLPGGFSTLCYDGQFFFNASHQEGSSPVQSNLTTSSLSDAALEAAATAMGAFVDDKGKPMRVKPDTLVVGPALERRAWNLVGSPVNVTKIGDGAAGTGATAATGYSNFFYGRYNLVVNPYLIGSAAYNWFLLDTKKEVKPIVIQSRSDVPITFETDMDLPSAKILEKYQFTARGRYVQGYGLWQTAWGSTANA
jgi:phage major head subunit gpT-like protein